MLNWLLAVRNHTVIGLGSNPGAVLIQPMINWSLSSSRGSNQPVGFLEPTDNQLIVGDQTSTGAQSPNHMLCCACVAWLQAQLLGLRIRFHQTFNWMSVGSLRLTSTWADPSYHYTGRIKAEVAGTLDFLVYLNLLLINSFDKNWASRSICTSALEKEGIKRPDLQKFFPFLPTHVRVEDFLNFTCLWHVVLSSRFLCQVTGMPYKCACPTVLISPLLKFLAVWCDFLH